MLGSMQPVLFLTSEVNVITNRILFETMSYLANASSTSKIIDLRMTGYFTVVQLDDGSVGACMSYYDLSDEILQNTERTLLSICRDVPQLATDHGILDSLIAPYVHDETQRRYVLASFTASLASALSAPIIRDGGDDSFAVCRDFPKGWANNAESALVVGLGGLLERLLTEPCVKKVHTIDLLYTPHNESIRSHLHRLGKTFPEKHLSISHGITVDDLKKFDLLAITGSTLCNGTLEDLLAAARPDAMKVLQGQSASIYPKALFDAGINYVCTTLKPLEVMQLAQLERCGHPMRSLLEGNLRLIYLTPKGREMDSQ